MAPRRSGLVGFRSGLMFPLISGCRFEDMKWVGGWSFVFCLFCYLVLVFFLVCFKVLRVMHSIILLEQWLVILIQAIPFDTLDTP